MNTRTETKEELETELELLWTLLADGIISVDERNQISTAIQNELADCE
jgi:hypothetical protein